MRKILCVYQPRMLGDIVLGSSCIFYYKQKYPDTFIIYISGASCLTETNPYINLSLQIKIPKRFERFFFALIKFFIKNSIYLKYWKPEPNIFFSYLKCFNLTPENPTTKIYLSQKDIDLATNYLHDLKLSLTKHTIAFQGDLLRKWKNEYAVLELQDYLMNNFNIVFIHDKMKYNGKILNIRQAGAIISSCDLFVGAISGNLHIAASLGTPTIAIPNVFDPKWDMPKYYLPESFSNLHFVVEPLAVNFCGSFKCVSVDNEKVIVKMGDYSSNLCSFGFPVSCISTISSGMVIDKINSFFKSN